MAAAHCATTTTTFTLRLSSANHTPISRKQLLFVCSVPTPFPSKFTKRKNHLRPKLLKNLTKPYPYPLPIIPIDSPLEQFSNHALELKESQSDDNFHTQTSNSTGVIEGTFGNFSTRAVFKIGLYLVGAFVFQTIVTVWVLESADSHNKHHNLGSDNETTVLELGIDGKNKANSSFLMNGSGIARDGITYVDESELEGKIAEIRVMAMDAREKERLKSKGNGLSENDASVVIKTGIEKEVDRRLLMLRKRLQKSVNKAQLSSGSYLGKDGKVEDMVGKDDLNAKEGDETLMFKKKYKFKGPSTNPSHKPKGFTGSEDRSVIKMKNISSLSEDEMLRDVSILNKDVELLGNDKKLDPRNGDLQGSAPMSLEEDGGERTPLEEDAKFRRATRDKLRKERGRAKPGKEMRVGKTQPRIGNSLASSFERSPFRAVTPEESTNKEGDLLSRNSSLKGNKVGSKKLAYNIGSKKSDTDTDLWWLSLSYVLAILMRRGRDGEGPQGLYTLKSTSYITNSTSYTVAFEDRGDATNFCYILQSFFEDLGDFSADIVPLLTKELEQAVKSHSKKVIIVKKGQLQLYAGQPLADVEMALFSLVGRS